MRDGGQDMGSVARRSSDEWTVTVTARRGHSSGIFSAGSGHGAIYETARIVDAFRRELREPNLTFNVGLIGGGDGAVLDAGKVRIAATGKTNIIAATAIARGDLRALSAEQIARAKAKMAGDRRPVAKRREREHRVRPRRLSADGADRRATAPCSARLNPSTATSACRRWASSTRSSAARATSASSPPTSTALAGLGAARRGDHAPGEAVDIPSICARPSAPRS